MKAVATTLQVNVHNVHTGYKLICHPCELLRLRDVHQNIVRLSTLCREKQTFLMEALGLFCSGHKHSRVCVYVCVCVSATMQCVCVLMICVHAVCMRVS